MPLPIMAAAALAALAGAGTGYAGSKMRENAYQSYAQKQLEYELKKNEELQKQKLQSQMAMLQQFLGGGMPGMSGQVPTIGGGPQVPQSQTPGMEQEQGQGQMSQMQPQPAPQQQGPQSRTGSVPSPPPQAQKQMQPGTQTMRSAQPSQPAPTWQPGNVSIAPSGLTFSLERQTPAAYDVFRDGLTRGYKIPQIIGQMQRLGIPETTIKNEVERGFGTVWSGFVFDPAFVDRVKSKSGFADGKALEDEVYREAALQTYQLMGQAVMPNWAEKLIFEGEDPMEIKTLFDYYARKNGVTDYEQIDQAMASKIIEDVRQHDLIKTTIEEQTKAVIGEWANRLKNYPGDIRDILGSMGTGQPGPSPTDDSWASTTAVQTAADKQRATDEAARPKLQQYQVTKMNGLMDITNTLDQIDTIIAAREKRGEDVPTGFTEKFMKVVDELGLNVEIGGKTLIKPDQERVALRALFAKLYRLLYETAGVQLNVKEIEAQMPKLLSMKRDGTANKTVLEILRREVMNEGKNYIRALEASNTVIGPEFDPILDTFRDWQLGQSNPPPPPEGYVMEEELPMMQAH